ncbi:MAG: phosphate ABC transporter permease PstA [Dehalococcoidia bacterium]|nr:phosphate ABC transporter permease PstA [Dehalococcoidia bacterium]
MLGALTLIIRKGFNFMMVSLCVLGAVLAMTLVCMMLGYILVHGITFFNLDFITNEAAFPIGTPGGGMRNEIIGTAIIVSLGTLIAVPVGLFAGIFLSEFASPTVASSVRFAADILSGVPSIVVGIFAYAIIVRPMHSFSAISAAVALAIIMLPVVARTTEESMRLVPGSLREAALALGITRWRSVLSVVIPGAMTGIVTGVILGMARIAGETAPLLFTAFGSNFSFESLSEPIAALPLQIYRYAMSPYQDWLQQAWAGAFLLAMMVLVVSLAVRFISRKRGS